MICCLIIIQSFYHDILVYKLVIKGTTVGINVKVISREFRNLRKYVSNEAHLLVIVTGYTILLSIKAYHIIHNTTHLEVILT